MSDRTKELWLFTMRFPYGNGEPFLENELPLLCERFKLVRIFPMFKEEGARSLPENTVVEDLIDHPYKGAGPLMMLREQSSWRVVVKEMRTSCPSKDIWKKQWPDLRSKLRQSIRHADILQRRMAKGFDPAKVVLYSYWTYDWATVLGLLKLKDERINFYTRMLGFDMFTFRSEDGWPAFRTFHLNQIKRVFIISQAGMDHMVENYPSFQHKYRLSFLGTRDHGTGPWEKSDHLRMASCSHLVPLKRVHLIAEALLLLDRKVTWTHFGHGPEEDRIRGLMERMPDPVQVELKGNTPNEQVIEWYRSNPLDMFIHVSSTEGGAPVALQEAASFGVPLIGADSGGIKEIVTEWTGQLLPHDVAPEQLAEVIERFTESEWYTAEKRKEVRKFWAKNFRSEVVFGQFAEQLYTGE